MILKNEDYISLREAAEMTGYTADYIGQLIRGGKLPGKQVFSNVAWVTTKEAVLEYAQKDKKGKAGEVFQSASLIDSLLTVGNLTRMYIFVGWIVSILLVIVVLFFGYVFAVSVDHRINANYLEKIEYAE